MTPDGGPNEQRGRRETGTINIGGYEVVRSRAVAFAFSAGDRTRGFISVQLLIVLFVGLAVVWTGYPIGKCFIAKSLEIQFAFSCGPKNIFQVSLI